MPVGLIEAALPDPSTPAFVPFVAVLGAFLGALYGRIQGVAPDERRELVEAAAFYLTAIGLLMYLTAQVMDLD